MKITLPLLLILLTIKVSANENWITIQSTNKTQVSKSNTKLETTLSQIVPINQMMQKATVIKKLIDMTNKKEKQSDNKQNWFVIE